MTEDEIRDTYQPGVDLARLNYSEASKRFAETPSAANFSKMEYMARIYQTLWANLGEAIAARRAMDNHGKVRPKC